MGAGDAERQDVPNGFPEYYDRPWSQLRDEMVARKVQKVSQLPPDRVKVYRRTTKWVARLDTVMWTLAGDSEDGLGDKDCELANMVVESPAGSHIRPSGAEVFRPEAWRPQVKRSRAAGHVRDRRSACLPARYCLWRNSSTPRSFHRSRAA